MSVGVVLVIAICNLIAGLVCGFVLGMVWAWRQEDKEEQA